jgi:hypothetical protein
VTQKWQRKKALPPFVSMIANNSTITATNPKKYLKD